MVDGCIRTHTGDDLSADGVLRIAIGEGEDLLEEHPNLMAYMARAEARPAYKRAYAAQRAVFTAATKGA